MASVVRKYVIGIDLSGPRNAADTVLVSFEPTGRRLQRNAWLPGADDRDILDFVAGFDSRSRVVVGIDAPLSYNVGGGDRLPDAELRKLLTAAGLKPGSVMTPTMTRMVYLTLRGISVARMLKSLPHVAADIVEVHPGGGMVLRGAPAGMVAALKADQAARLRLLAWLEEQGLADAADIESPSDHYVAACSAALSAWKWYLGESVWLQPAEPPIHPFDYAC